MVDDDLAELYEIPVKVLNQAVKRNRSRFPGDFMFQLTVEESDSLRSHFVTLKTGRGQHRKYRPYAFTEQGVAMLSSVLHSARAIRVNIAIMRAFVQLREMIGSTRGLPDASMSWRRNTIPSFGSSSRQFVNSWRSQSPRSNESVSKPNCVTAVDDLTNCPDLPD